MLRTYLALAGLALLAGCESTPPPHIAAMQSRCAVGDNLACGTLAQADAAANQRAIAAAQLFSANNQAIMASNTALFSQPTYMPQSSITCLPVGNGMSCF